MTEDNNYLFTLILKEAWGEVMTTDEKTLLSAFKDRSPYHQEVADRFGDIGWINGGMAQLADFPKELIRQKIQGKLTEQAEKRPPYQVRKEGYIDAETPKSHIKVHKHWRFTFVIVFVLFKLLLAYAIFITIKFVAMKRLLDEVMRH